MRRAGRLSVVVTAPILLLGLGAPSARAADDILIRGATVVTMDADHTVIPRGRVLVSGSQIEAVWRRGRRPAQIDGQRLARATTVQPGRDTYLFPGLVNLHDHPTYDMLEAWPAPSSDAIPEAGKAGTDPYDNRYEWNTDGPAEYDRLVRNPQEAIVDPDALDLRGAAVKYAEVQAMLGGETSMQGASFVPEADGLLVRNVESNVFNSRIAPPRVSRISSLTGGALAGFVAATDAGTYDAWMVHLAEGVRDAQRRPGDPVSSRQEFDELRSKGLLTAITVVVHGVGLERGDFAAMADVGAKLVWSPRSNLQLYGRTANVYDALAEDVLVSLGTDWTPSGSANLLGELKVADRALRDSRVLGDDRATVPDLANDEALDRALVDMVTRNPVRTLHWQKFVGSIEPELRADLFLLREPTESSNSSPYRSLIDAGEDDVRLVLIDGHPVAGTEQRMERLNPGGTEILTIPDAAYRRAIDVTKSGVPEGEQNFAQFSGELGMALAALGGDNPPADGGPSPDSNTYSYLKAHWANGSYAGSSDAEFRAVLTNAFGLEQNGWLNLERIEMVPPVDDADDFLGYLLNGTIDPNTGLLADPAPPFGLYPANLNHIGPLGNPLAGLP
jgi:cytosine/adenosine deaminase-related metal-dependent hydrolase